MHNATTKVFFNKSDILSSQHDTLYQTEKISGNQSILRSLISDIQTYR